MSKKTILILIALSTNQLFCAQADKATTEKEYCIWEKYEDVTEDIHFTHEPSHLITEDHALLTREVFFPSPAACPPNYCPNFLEKVKNSMDILISAHNKYPELHTGIGTLNEDGTLRLPLLAHYEKELLVGGLFGRKLKDPHTQLKINAKTALMQLNCIYVKQEKQKKGIGRTMVQKFMNFSEHLPVVLVLLASNQSVRTFFEKCNFNVATDIEHPTGEGSNLAWNLITQDNPATTIPRDTLVAYYHANETNLPCPTPILP